jgi:hypothetical protein
MNLKNVWLITLLFSGLEARIHILLSAALTPAHYNFRKAQYIKAFKQLASFGYGPERFYVVEALKKTGPTFLEEYCKNVFYATTNNPRLTNNGINEALTVLEATYHFKFKPEDMIIKITGRHYLRSKHFMRIVKQNPQYDAFVRIDGNGDVFTVGFAMKCKHLQEMYKNIDYPRMERNHINLEHEVGNYIKRKVQEGNFNVLYMDKLDIVANNFGSSTAPGAPDNLIFF